MTARSHPKAAAPGPAANTALNRAIGVIALVGVVAIIGIALLLSRPVPFVPEVVGAPHAAPAVTVIDHGDVRMEAWVESIFTIRNTGDQPLQILDEPRVELVQGCCPPRAIVSRMTLEPGEETTVMLRYTMFDMMGGPHEFRVHVPTNDPANPLIALTSLSNWIE